MRVNDEEHTASVAVSDVDDRLVVHVRVENQVPGLSGALTYNAFAELGLAKARELRDQIVMAVGRLEIKNAQS